MSDLESALEALQLGHFLPKLRQLGVDNLSQVPFEDSLNTYEEVLKIEKNEKCG